MAGEIEYEIAPSKGLSLNLKELREYKELFYFFTWRDIKVKYKQTLLGISWAFIQPFLMMVIFTLFFSKGLSVPSNGMPYPIFVFTGLLLWNIFSAGLANAANSMVTNSNIIKKIYFPRLIIPMSSILVAVFDFLMAFVIYIGIFIYYKYSFSIMSFLLVLPISLIITILTTFGLGCLLASLNIKYRDFRYVIPFMIQILLFVTPVIYPSSIVKSLYIKKLLSLNPLAIAIELLRSSIDGREVEWTQVGLGIGTSIFIFFIGLVYFRKTEAYFADLA